MRNYELVFNNGSGKDFQAKNLREARKVAKVLKANYNGKCWIYEGYTNIADA